MHGPDTERLRLLRQTEDLRERVRKKLHEHKTNEHDDRRVNKAAFNTLLHALLRAHAVVVGNDRRDRISKAKAREENELLDLVEDAVCCDGRRRHRAENNIDAIGHEAHQRLHDNRADANAIDAADRSSIRLQIAEAALYFLIFRVLKDHREDERDHLAHDRRPGRARDTHSRAAEKAVNHDRVEDDIRERTRDLRGRRQNRLARRLQELLIDAVEQVAEAQQRTDPEIRAAHAEHDRVRRLALQIDINARQSENKEHRRQHDSKKYAISGDPRRLLRILETEHAREHRADTDAGSDSERDDQHLDRKCKRERVDRVLTGVCDARLIRHIRDEHGIDDVVHGLQHHRNNNRNAHRKHDLRYFFRTHFVSYSLFHSCLLNIFQVTRHHASEPVQTGHEAPRPCSQSTAGCVRAATHEHKKTARLGVMSSNTGLPLQSLYLYTTLLYRFIHRISNCQMHEIPDGFPSLFDSLPFPPRGAAVHTPSKLRAVLIAAAAPIAYSICRVTHPCVQIQPS